MSNDKTFKGEEKKLQTNSQDKLKTENNIFSLLPKL